MDTYKITISDIADEELIGYVDEYLNMNVGRKLKDDYHALNNILATLLDRYKKTL